MNQIYDPLDPSSRAPRNPPWYIYDIFGTASYRIGVCAMQSVSGETITVYDGTGSRVGSIRYERGEQRVFNSYGEEIGYVSLNAEVYNDSGSMVGYIGHSEHGGPVSRSGSGPIKGIYRCSSFDGQREHVGEVYKTVPGYHYPMAEECGGAALLLLIH